MGKKFLGIFLLPFLLASLLQAAPAAKAPVAKAPDWDALNAALDKIEENFNKIEDTFWSSYFAPRRDPASVDYEKLCSSTIHLTREFKNRIAELQSKGLLPRYIDISNDYAIEAPIPVIAGIFRDMNRNAISNVWKLKKDWKMLPSSGAAATPEASLEGEPSPRTGLTLDQERHLLEVQHICNSNFKYAFIPMQLDGKCKKKHDCRIHSLRDYKETAMVLNPAELCFAGAKKNTRKRTRRQDLVITSNDVNRLDVAAGGFYNAVYDMREAIVRMRQLLALAQAKKFPVKSLKQTKQAPARELAQKTVYAEILADYVEDDFWVGYFCSTQSPSYKRLHDRLFMLLVTMRRIKALTGSVPAAKNLRKTAAELPAVRLLKILELKHDATYVPEWQDVKRASALNDVREVEFENGGTPAFVEYKNGIRDLRKALMALHDLSAEGAEK